jgi:cell division protein FtsA
VTLKKSPCATWRASFKRAWKRSSNWSTSKSKAPITRKKLIGGIVVTGGGSQLKHLTQLIEYLTGMDARIGYPTEHLANTNDIDVLSSPKYATGIGLVLKGFESFEAAKPWEQQPITKQEDPIIEKTIAEKQEKIKTHSNAERRGEFFGRILDPLKKFFDDSED